MLNPVFQNPWVRAAALVGALVLVCMTAYVLSPVLIPLLMAFFVAYILDPAVDHFEKRGYSRGRAVTIFALIGVTLLIVVPPLTVISIKNQAQVLIEAPNEGSGGSRQKDLTDRAFDVVERWVGLDDLVVMLGWDKEVELPDAASVAEMAKPETTPPSPTPDSAEPETDAPTESPDDGEPEGGPSDSGESDTSEAADPDAATLKTKEDDIDARAIIAAKIGTWVQRNAVEFLESHFGAISTAGREGGLTLLGLARTIANFIVGIVLTLANIALFGFVAGYLLKDFDAVVGHARNLIPVRHRDYTVGIVKQIDSQLRAFFRGQLTVAACLGGMYAIGFWISGTPLALMIGAFGFAASFVPYLGVVLTALLAISLTLLAHGISFHLVGVLITIGLAQFLEGNVLTPRIVGNQVGLNPVWVILAVLVFGNLLGFLGLLIAVPTAAAMKVLVMEALAYYKRSPVYEGPGDSGE